MFRWNCKKAIAGLVLLVVAGIGTAAFIPLQSAVQETPPSNFVVHEWGTFTTFSGSNGEMLEFYPTAEDLPPFVYHGTQAIQGKQPQLLLTKGQMSTLVSLETPVLYFYADRELTASVDVVFPKGRLTEHYPRSNSAPGNWLRWDGLKVLPGAAVDFPVAAGPTRYYAAREVDAAPIRMDTVATSTEPTDTTLLRAAVNKVFGLPNVREVKTAKSEHEKFIFYRGVGNFAMPLKLTAEKGGSVKFMFQGYRFGKSVLVRIAGKKVWFKEIMNEGGWTEIEAALPEPESSLDQLREVMVRLLTERGLYEKEARAMVKTWDTAWFGEDGTRLLYLLGSPITEDLLPLRINPQPNKLIRVLVGRHDFLTPEREREIDALVKKSDSEILGSERAMVEKELSKLGRFQSPATSAATARLRKVGDAGQ